MPYLGSRTSAAGKWVPAHTQPSRKCPFTAKPTTAIRRCAARPTAACGGPKRRELALISGPSHLEHTKETFRRRDPLRRGCALDGSPPLLTSSIRSSTASVSWPLPHPSSFLCLAPFPLLSLEVPFRHPSRRRSLLRAHGGLPKQQQPRRQQHHHHYQQPASGRPCSCSRRSLCRSPLAGRCRWRPITSVASARRVVCVCGCRHPAPATRGAPRPMHASSPRQGGWRLCQ